MLARLRPFVVLLVVVVLAAGWVLSGRPRVLYRTSRSFAALAADDAGLVWLEQSKPTVPGGSLYAMAPGGKAQCLYPGETVAEIAPAGAQVVALEGTTLEAFPRRGGPPKVLAANLSQPAGLAVDGNTVYWTETTAPLTPHVWSIPATQYRLVVKSMPLDGTAAPRLVALAEGDRLGFAGWLLGVRDQRLYWADLVDRLSGGWTQVRATPVDGGPTELLAVEEAGQLGLLYGGALYYTGATEDGASPKLLRCLRRMPLPQGPPTTVTDWVPPGGRLSAVGGALYHASRWGIWRLPTSLGRPRFIEDKRPVVPVLAARAGALYEVRYLPRAKMLALMSRPVTWWARVRW